MSNRYVVSGVQLGMLFSKEAATSEDRSDLYQEILKEQWIGFSETNVKEDASHLLDKLPNKKGL